MILSAEKVSRSYNGRSVLHECSLSVQSGKCLVLKGPSGGGKSTLLRILALLEPADSGFVLHDELRLDVSQPQRSPAYPFLTLVFQQLYLWPNLTIQQNLAIVLSKDPKAPLRETAIKLLKQMEVGQLLNRRPHECSLGERQRVALARALLSEVKFLLLDEPSSALDKANTEILVEQLKLAKDNGRGILLVTHDERSFQDISDNILRIENGQLNPL